MTACWITNPYKIFYKVLGNASFQNRNDNRNSAKSEKWETDQGLIWGLLDYVFSIVMGQQNKQIIQIIWMVLVYIKIKVHIKKCL